MDHFKAAERALREAEELYNEALQGPIEESKANTIQAEYKMRFANAHTALAGIQSQQVGFKFVGQMADSVEKDVVLRGGTAGIA